ncbi:MAG TPA: CoA transferase [Acidimicrobiia bacterium]|jgi:crotonobetainyl-CoA:carnitine CoA-transferase CaiB-like acyl-CoA transferase
MAGVLHGVKVVEVSMWGYVPSAGAALAEWGAEVVKVEPPTGDPIRGLVTAGVGPMDGIVFPWELWNRRKQSIVLDLKRPEATEILLRLCEQADVFLTSYLPPVRRRLGFDVDAVRARNPQIVYACGSGQGAQGPEAEKGGYDSITFWARGGVAASVTPPGHPRPIGMPCGAFGDSISGMSLAGGIAAALVKKARTGEGSLVDGSLLGTAMWAMQMGSVGAAVAMASAPDAGKPASAPPPPGMVFNPLVNNYETSDHRWVALCMLQPDLYYEGLVRALGRDDMVSDERFATPEARTANGGAIVDELRKTFAELSLAEARQALGSQRGQWDVVNRAIDLLDDPQGIANGFVQSVDYGDGRTLPMFTTPVHFDRDAPVLTPAPEFGADTDEILASIGMDTDAILQAKIDGGVV